MFFCNFIFIKSSTPVLFHSFFKTFHFVYLFKASLCRRILEPSEWCSSICHINQVLLHVLADREEVIWLKFRKNGWNIEFLKFRASKKRYFVFVRIWCKNLYFTTRILATVLYFSRCLFKVFEWKKSIFKSLDFIFKKSLNVDLAFW